MPKKLISSLELAAIVNELQFLVKGKVSQIYQQDKTELVLQLHAIDRGKQLLKIVPGKYLSLTKTKEAPLNPTWFSMLLRKYLSNAFIKSITQKSSERILVLELEKKETFYLIIELFSTGNIVLTDKNYIIIGTLDRQIWKDRVVKPNEEYIFPKPKVDWKELTEEKLKEMLKNSEKKNIAITLATEVGLGGVYAEEICKINEINKEAKSQEIYPQEITAIHKAIKNLLLAIKEPHGFIYEEEITPFPLLDQQEKKKTESYLEALDTINPFQTVSPYEQKIGALKRMIKMQEGAIKKQEDKIELNTKRGELIYEKYAPLQRLIDIVKEMKETKGWLEISEELKKNKKIQGVDLKNKTVAIEL